MSKIKNPNGRRAMFTIDNYKAVRQYAIQKGYGKQKWINAILRENKDLSKYVEAFNKLSTQL